MTDLERPALPGIFCPIEPVAHPAVERIEARSIEWLRAGDFLDDPYLGRALVATRSAEFMARMAPHGRVDRLQIAADWAYWGFAFDDRFDRGPLSRDLGGFVSCANRIVRALEAPGSNPVRTDPLLSGLIDISTRFAECVTPVQHRRWTQAHRAWLFGVCAEMSTTATPTVDEYLTIRINNAAGEVVTATTELVNEYEPPAAELELPRVRALTEMARMLAALDNDLHSHRKTVALNESNQFDLLTVIAARDTCGLDEAVVRAVRLRDRIMCRFLVAGARTGGLSTDTRHYLHGLRHVVRGNLDWALEVERYAVDGRTVADCFTIGDSPTDSAPDSPGLPSIDWWWQV
ncbi:terpene synthase family protein [Nocardia sp. NPDC003963]